jgi:MFS transporter, ACS family, solute carrier family 17 (sodium-dependent inorganic phosphate cotransporter), other
MQGIAFPAVHSIIAAVVPQRWQSSAVATVTAASYAGAALATAASPYIIQQHSWQAVFYSFGASALLWLPFWLVAGMPPDILRSDKTAANAHTELPAALNGTETTDRDADIAAGDEIALRSPGRLGDDVETLLPARQEDGGGLQLPVATIASSRAFGMDRAFWGLVRRKEVWAICIAQYCQSWGMYALLNWLPTFFNEQVRWRSLVQATVTSRPGARH